MDEIRALLRDGCDALGLVLSGETMGAVVAYVQLLQRWNRRINLVGTRDLGGLVAQHVVDALAVTLCLPDGPGRLIDVGSGAGLPGALIAIARPDVAVTALEPIHKKQAFIATVQRELSLGNLRALAQRMEEHAGFVPYDMAVSRATFALPEWLSRARGLVREGGTILAMEGREQHVLPSGAVRRRYVLGDRRRAIVVWRVGGDVLGRDG